MVWGILEDGQRVLLHVELGNRRWYPNRVLEPRAFMPRRKARQLSWLSVSSEKSRRPNASYCSHKRSLISLTALFDRSMSRVESTRPYISTTSHYGYEPGRLLLGEGTIELHRPLPPQRRPSGPRHARHEVQVHGGVGRPLSAFA